MTAAIALAVVLVIVVAGASMAVESQRPSGGARSVRPPRVTPPRRPRRWPSERPRPEPVAEQPSEPAPPAATESRGPDLLRTGTPAVARVVSVVDERTIGPVTRSRLALEIEAGDGGAFEVTVRMAFPTPEARAQVRVGGTVPVRYDPNDRTRVVVDLPQQ